jgi:hypothetical protein
MKNTNIVIAFIFFVLVYQQTIVAQDIQATTDAGEKVVLKKDGTWHSLKDISSNMPSFEKLSTSKTRVNDPSGHFAFYYDAKKWNKSKKLGEDAMFSFSNKDDNAWLMILEELAPLSYEEVKNALLKDLKKENIEAKIIIEEKRIVNGFEINYLVFDAEIEGIIFRYYNYIYSGDGYYVRETAYSYQKFQNENTIVTLLNGLKINSK